jgi:hypothetical protein
VTGGAQGLSAENTAVTAILDGVTVAFIPRDTGACVSNKLKV